MTQLCETHLASNTWKGDNLIILEKVIITEMKGEAKHGHS